MLPYQIALAFRWLRNLLLFVGLLLSRNLGAQAHPADSALPPAPKPSHPDPRSWNDRAGYFAGIFCGTGASTSAVATKPTVGCGAGLSFFPLPLFVEVGVMGPQANRSDLSGYISTDVNLPLAPSHFVIMPETFFGYSRLFETGHAVDYGLALIAPRPWKPAEDMRFELRDYWTFANPNQHNVMLRIGLISPVSD